MLEQRDINVTIMITSRGLTLSLTHLILLPVTWVDVSRLLGKLHQAINKIAAWTQDFIVPQYFAKNMFSEEYLYNKA